MVDFLDVTAVIQIHEMESLRRGTAAGILHLDRVEGAVNRPKSLAYYNPTATIYELATALAYGIANGHGFVDGNKRTSFVACNTFLLMNNVRIVASSYEKVDTWLAIAKNKIKESDFTIWLQSHCRSSTTLDRIATGRGPLAIEVGATLYVGIPPYRRLD
jgi:death-on-curing protein